MKSQFSEIDVSNGLVTIIKNPLSVDIQRISTDSCAIKVLQVNEDLIRSYRIIVKYTYKNEVYFDKLYNACELVDIVITDLLKGEKYQVEVLAIKKRSKNRGSKKEKQVVQAKAVMRAEHTRQELYELFIKSLQFIDKNRANNIHKPDFLPCSWIYRDKSASYAKNIMSKHGMVMKKYPKDINGDLANCINGQLEGLFFSVNVVTDITSKYYGQPFNTSLFGEVRFLLPSTFLFVPSTRIYLADFYCIKKAHWVTLVITKIGSDADVFCSNKLQPIPKNVNPFLFMDVYGVIWVCTRVWVEVLYTENIHLVNDRVFMRQVLCRNKRHGGKPKNTSCKICHV